MVTWIDWEFFSSYILNLSVYDAIRYEVMLKVRCLAEMSLGNILNPQIALNGSSIAECWWLECLCECFLIQTCYTEAFHSARKLDTIFVYLNNNNNNKMFTIWFKYVIFEAIFSEKTEKVGLIVEMPSPQVLEGIVNNFNEHGCWFNKNKFVN